ncbi:MAG: DUF2336 domain-containing protein [Pseudorhodoplanes sp.]|uniref:DUF2336 domain-containing protein n=1 Tax=Pseudorhodoplanes sp. TaxID=1934341 RepID=UPI003D12C700
MAPAFSLIPELESVVRHGSDERRLDALRRITALFLHGSSRFNDDHIRLFDAVFVMLINEIESKAREELSRQLAPVARSPIAVVRRLARDEDIMVAGPVLAQSPRLVTADLVEIAGSMSPEHLYAISSRTAIEEPVTDILVRRGDFIVRRKLAGNSGAKISENGFTTLIRSAEHDSVLAETVALRSDVPDHMFRELLSRATEVVQRRLLANARPETQARIQTILTRISGEVLTGKPTRDFSEAEARMRALAETGQLGEVDLADFARKQSYDDTVAALSQLTGVPTGVVDRLMCGERPDPILILCKAAGHAWPTAREILLARLGNRGKGAPSLDAASANFDRLSAATARRVVRFWQVSPVGLKNAV